MQLQDKFPSASSKLSFEEWPEPCVYQLSDTEQRDLRATCHELPNLKMSELNDLSLWEQINLLSDELPYSLRKFLAQFKLASNKWGFVIVRGLPKDEDLPPTPSIDQTFGNYQFNTFAKATALIGARFGYPRAYRDEKNRLVMQPIYPRPEDAMKQENSSSLTLLEEHTEDGFLREFCDFLLLSCVRSDHDRIARTGVSCAWQALDYVEWNVINVLQQPRFVVEAPSSFSGISSSVPLTSCPLPVLFGDLRKPRMIFDLAAMRGLDAQAQEAMRQFGEALRKVHYSGVLQGADCLFVDNQTSVHTRSCFLPRFDGNDRLLLRLKLFLNPRACASSRLFNSLTCGSITFELPS